MRGFSPDSSFEADVASRYDDQPRGDEAAATALLHALAGDGRVLEFAVGTGRLALPLAACGVAVDGIELSQAMVDRLRAKPGGEVMDVWLGDMTTTDTGRRYSLVFIAFNSVFNVLTQDGQVECFVNAARHLDDGGRFIVEAAVPSAWLPADAYARPERVEAREVTLDVCRYDPITQTLDENHVTIGRDGIRMAPISTRLIWPGELA